MEISTDFKELFALFGEHGVEYLVVGGYALAFHGAPRSTGDIDILLPPTMENARRVLAALEAFGFASLGLTHDDFSTADSVVQLGQPPYRIDLLTSIDGVTWTEAVAGSDTAVYGGLSVPVIGKAQLIANKRATGRARDLADIEALGG